MIRLLCPVHIVLTLIILNYSSVTGYRWITVPRNKPLPLSDMALLYAPNPQKYVGRTRSFMEMVPAEIVNSTTAYYCSHGKFYTTDTFEVLVDVQGCDWRVLPNLEAVTPQIVRVGYTWKGEPSYLAYTVNSNLNIASILLHERVVLKWINAGNILKGYFCPERSRYKNVYDKKIPYNAVEGGIACKTGAEVYLAYFIVNCFPLIGQITSDSKYAVGYIESLEIKAAKYQVLIGTVNEYRWVSARNGNIPDYAVSYGKSIYNQLSYWGRRNNTLRPIYYISERRFRSTYEVLVRNEDEEAQSSN